MSNEPEITIPYVDIREEGPVGLLKDHKQKLLNAVTATVGMFGVASRVAAFLLLPVGDFLARRWLKKTNNPYLPELEAFQKEIGIRGIIAFNMAYEWACTTGAFLHGDGTTLSRVLDWSLPKMGENVVVARQKGPAGEYDNVTWPGVTGIFNAMAKGRFAAAINQAPMRRHRAARSFKPFEIVGLIADWVRNRHLVNNATGLPPAQLLRNVFDTATTFDEAKKMLTSEPISIPVIYTLTGTKPGEGCVIERLENSAIVREMENGRVFAANHFETAFKDQGDGWLPRTTDTRDRAQCALDNIQAQAGEGFEWFKAPVANAHTRLVMTADAATGKLQLMGTVGAKPVTKVFRLG